MRSVLFSRPIRLMVLVPTMLWVISFVVEIDR